LFLNDRAKDLKAGQLRADGAGPWNAFADAAVPQNDLNIIMVITIINLIPVLFKYFFGNHKEK
jgi:hypothetical protein